MFIAVPVGMNYRTERLPWVTFSLIGLNTLVYLVSLVCYFSTDGNSDDWIMENLWLVPAQSHLWMYLTSMFVHANIFHLLGNMIFLFLFGSCVEDIIGRLRFAIFYLIGGLVAEIVYVAMIPEHFVSTVPMGGASGAISACMGMYLLLRADADIEFKYFFWFFFTYMRAGEFEIPAWMAISFWFLKDLLWAMLGLFYGHGLSGGVALGAHVGGFLGGLGLVAFYKGWVQPNEPAEEIDDRIIKPERIRMTVPPRPAASVTETPTIFLHDGTEQTGPFTLTQVQAKLRNGEINRDTQYWSEGMNDWQDVMELSDQPIA
jgi:membrane associated rhomboid family serine protease